MRRLLLSTLALTSLSALPARAALEDYPSIKLQGLDKSVGRTVTFEAQVGSTIQYGPLYIKIQACRKAPPIEKPESAAFLQIWEVPPGEQQSEWVFSGWMFASSPALSAIDHPVYDIWVLDCTGREEPNEEARQAESTEEADQGNLTPAAPDGAAPGATAPNPAPQDSGNNGIDAPAPVGTAPQVTQENPALPADAQTSPAPTIAPALPGQGDVSSQYPQEDIQPPVPQAISPADDHANDPNFTAYDLMRQPKQAAPAGPGMPQSPARD